MKHWVSVLGLSVVSALFLTSCGSDGSGTVKINMVKKAGARRALMAEGGRAANDSGQNTAAQLASLKYYFSSIQICKGLTYVGSRFDSTTDCVELYKNTALQSLGDLTKVTEAQVAATGDPIDLMDPTSVAKLNATSAEATAGEYNWAVITWAPYIKVKADVTKLGGGTTYHTKSTTGATVANGITTVTGNLATGTAEEATVISGNGGTFFRFTKPFVIAEGDNITMDLVFNPEGIIKAGPSCSNCSLKDGSNNGISVPMLNLTPVPRKTGETTMRRVCDVDFASANLTSRVELYYSGTDDTNFFGVNSVTTMKSGFSGLTTIEVPGKTTRLELSGSAISFYTSSESTDFAVLSGLTPTKGGSGTVTFNSGPFTYGITNGSYSYTCDATDETIN